MSISPWESQNVFLQTKQNKQAKKHIQEENKIADKATKTHQQLLERAREAMEAVKTDSLCYSFS